jgi:hypothetical protein
MKRNDLNANHRDAHDGGMTESTIGIVVDDAVFGCHEIS